MEPMKLQPRTFDNQIKELPGPINQEFPVTKQSDATEPSRLLKKRLAAWMRS